MKVLEIKKGEFLHEVRNGSITTTIQIQKALDVSEFSWEQISYLIENLHKVGYTTAKVVDYDKDKIEGKKSDIE